VSFSEEKCINSHLQLWENHKSTCQVEKRFYHKN